MIVSELCKQLDLKVAAGEDGVSRPVKGCYIGDLLSLAMARVDHDYVWVTIQTNVNIVAVASLAEAGCIIIADGFQPDEKAAQKADIEGIPILTTPKDAYRLAAELAALGI